MTRAQKKALTKFLGKESVTPRYADIRSDVARALFIGGYVRGLLANTDFRSGYAPLTITEKGREAAVAPLSAGDR